MIRRLTNRSNPRPSLHLLLDLVGFVIVLGGAMGCSDAVSEGPEVETAAAAVGPRPLFQLPFRCGQTWEASTYNGHWPDQDSIDLGRWSGSTNISDGEPVLASANGTVQAVYLEGGTSSPDLGNAIVLDHGGGWLTHYVHLKDAPTVTTGDFVARGTQIGRVGQTGGANGESHLHYTQLADGEAVRISFGGVPIGTHAGTVGQPGTGWGDGEALTAGDADGDGLCDTEDLCPVLASTINLDRDRDGLGDPCDTCPTRFDPSNRDRDGDGLGDVCDDDDDGDGCVDTNDQNPFDDSARVGIEVRPNCSPSSAPHYLFDGYDSDNDGLLNCADADDDNDGIVDGYDPCPVVAGDVCVYAGPSCPLHPIFFTCRGGACNAQILRIQEVVNPDPTRTLDYAIVSVTGDEILVAPLTGRTLSASADGVRGALPFAGRLPRGALRMEIVSRTTRRRLLDVASYVSSSVQLGTLTGTRLGLRVSGSVLRVQGR